MPSKFAHPLAKFTRIPLPKAQRDHSAVRLVPDERLVGPILKALVQPMNAADLHGYLQKKVKGWKADDLLPAMYATAAQLKGEGRIAYNAEGKMLATGL